MPVIIGRMAEGDCRSFAAQGIGFLERLATLPDTQIGHHSKSDEETQVRLYHQHY